MQFVTVAVALLLVNVRGGPSDDLVNVALGKPAAHIDTHCGLGANLVNDGRDESPCSLTYATEKTWWMVDLLADYRIMAVRVTNNNANGERLRRFSVHVSQENPISKIGSPHYNPTPNQLCFYRDEMVPQGRGELIACDMPVYGRYVILSKPGDDRLSICELEVLAMLVSGLDYHRHSGKKVSKNYFYKMDNITDARSCLVRCRRAGSATAVQHHEVGGKCECVQISGFDSPKPALTNGLGWRLYLAKNN